MGMVRRSFIGGALATLATPALAKGRNRFPINDTTVISVDNVRGDDHRGSLTHPFRSLQAACDFVSIDLMLNNARVIVQAKETNIDYEPINHLKPWVGTCDVDPSAGGTDPGPNFTAPIIRGNPRNPEKIRIKSVGGAITAVDCRTPWLVHGFSFVGTGDGLIGADFGSRLYLGQNNYSGPALAYIVSIWDSMVEVLRGFGGTICGDGQRFAFAQSGGKIIAQDKNPFTFSGHPKFISAVVSCYDSASIVDLRNVIWSGDVDALAVERNRGGDVIGAKLIPGRNS